MFRNTGDNEWHHSIETIHGEDALRHTLRTKEGTFEQSDHHNFSTINVIYQCASTKYIWSQQPVFYSSWGPWCDGKLSLVSDSWRLNSNTCFQTHYRSGNLGNFYFSRTIRFSVPLSLLLKSSYWDLLRRSIETTYENAIADGLFISWWTWVPIRAPFECRVKLSWSALPPDIEADHQPNAENKLLLKHMELERFCSNVADQKNLSRPWLPSIHQLLISRLSETREQWASFDCVSIPNTAIGYGEEYHLPPQRLRWFWRSNS